MSFSTPSGPPAGHRQIARLEELLGRAGFESFREARHPYGLTQRQAGGRFSVAEADLLIERLEAAELVGQAEEAEPVDAGDAADVGGAARTRGGATARTPLAGIGAAELADELERRGWCCIPPVTTE